MPFCVSMITADQIYPTFLAVLMLFSTQAQPIKTQYWLACFTGMNVD